MNCVGNSAKGSGKRHMDLSNSPLVMLGSILRLLINLEDSLFVIRRWEGRPRRKRKSILLRKEGEPALNESVIASKKSL